MSRPAIPGSSPRITRFNADRDRDDDEHDLVEPVRRLAGIFLARFPDSPMQDRICHSRLGSRSPSSVRVCRRCRHSSVQLGPVAPYPVRGTVRQWHLGYQVWRAHNDARLDTGTLLRFEELDTGWTSL